MAVNRQAFFDSVRASLFNGNLTQPQVDGLNAILDGFDRRYPNGDLRWLAYYLATAKWETAGTMEPVREAFWLSEQWRRDNLRYYPYYGRGYVQLTWKNNYQRQSQADRTGIDLVTNPDVALKADIAAQVLFVGMEHGDFGGGGMAHYFSGTTEDPLHARQLVNIMDHAEQIAALYASFKTALTGAAAPPAPTATA
jgi:hypothetical protein